MGFLSIDWLKAFILLCCVPIIGYNAAESYFTWFLTREWIFDFNTRDYYVTLFCIIPTVLGHFATLWGHYFRSEREFQHSIAKVTTPVSVKQKISLWEHHILWGYTVKYWLLVGFVVVLNFAWVVVKVAPKAAKYIDKYKVIGGLGLLIGESTGYAAMAACGVILFLVLRRSMLHALGFTYAEILPLHRWLGVAIVVWSILHTIGYLMYYAWDKSLHEALNFYDTGRATMNLMGFVALFALLILAFLSLPQYRRRCYGMFMGIHRVMTVVFFLSTIVHFPYYMLWYYYLPSTILFFIDRFVPKMIQRRTFYPEASCTLNADADIIKMTFTSPEPMKPYYPGDYILVEVPELGTLYHPFTIASYWAEDPKSIVLFIRTYGDSKKSWTGQLARLCGTEDKRIRIKANVDGVFGDRRHDYLKSEYLIFFVAGAAITTFMALIKAIAAQIASSNEPLRIHLHLICTFRTRSELHAYGSFLHQVTRDPRFTSWLHVEIYVSRPDKPQTLMGAHAHVIKNDIMVPAIASKKDKKKRFRSLRRTGTMLKRALSGRTIVESTVQEGKMKRNSLSHKPDDEARAVTAAVVNFSTLDEHVRSISVDTVVGKESGRSSSNSTEGNTEHTIPISTRPTDEIEARDSDLDLSSSMPTRDMTYDTKRLPTFHDADSTNVSNKLAKLDLTVSAILVLIPFTFWYILRAIHWEGSPHYCDVMGEMDNIQQRICYGTYATIPPFGHLLAMCAIGYLSLMLARRTLVRSLFGSSAKDIESGRHTTQLPYPDFDIEDEKLSVEDGNWDEGDVVFSKGRVNVKLEIERFMSSGIGTAGNDKGLVTVFGGGPEAFVDHVERQIKASKWAVDFHRETWAP
ncbi:ferric/cupric-chelate reductase [Haplosporangium sp. Z 11]|nr:ferric/cupric-chelate reductase [Haplosporangium sp. Z 11]